MADVVDLVASQQWLEPVETATQKGVAQAFAGGGEAGRRIQDFLHGTWLGHPLHPALTDVPLGAWTAAAAFDIYELATEDETFAPGADLAVGIGLIGAAGAAVTGLNDWNATSDKPQRVGAVHALCNVTATACYVASW